MAKKDLIAEARNKGLDVNEKMTVAQIEKLLEKAEADVTAPTAGQDARSSDPGSEGEYTKTFVIDGEYNDARFDDYAQNVRGQALQVGLTLTGDVRVASQETVKGRRRDSTRVTFSAPCIRSSRI